MPDELNTQLAGSIARFSRQRHHATVWSDGGCWPNPGPGAWASIVEVGGERLELSGSEAQTTNNRMELSGAIAGMRQAVTVFRTLMPSQLSVRRSILLVSDSQYVTNGVEWLRGWVGRGWRTSSGSPVLNRDLWEDVLELRRVLRIETRWVRGHSGHPENERCDALCRELLGR